MENNLDRLIEKVDKIHAVVIRTEEAVVGLEKRVAVQNGRIGHLEMNSEKGIAERATYEEKLRSHMAADEKSQGQLDKDVRSITKKIWIAIGAASGLTAALPYLLKSAGL